MKISILLFLIAFSFSYFRPEPVVSQNVWTSIADFGGGRRYSCSSFSIGNYGYTGLGYDGVAKRDWWKYDPSNNSWSQVADHPLPAKWSARAFVIDSLAYVVSGASFQGYRQEMYCYDPATNTWASSASFLLPRQDFFAFSANGKGYLTCGWGSAYYKDLWEFDPQTNLWTQKSNFPGAARDGLDGFVVNGKAYVGMGYNGVSIFNDFYEYDPFLNSWTAKSNFAGAIRNCGAAFAIGDFGYMGCGSNYMISRFYNDFFRYDPAADQWDQIRGFPMEARDYPAVFVINNEGYVGTGKSIPNTYYSNFYKYTPASVLNSIEDAGNEKALSLILKDNHLIISSNKFISGLLKVNIYTVTGSLVMTSEIAGSPWVLPLKEVQSGLYIYQVFLKDNCLMTGKFIL